MNEPVSPLPAHLAVGPVPTFVKGDTKTVQAPNGTVVSYELFKVVDEYHPSLTRKNYDWDFTNPPGDIQYIAASLISTMLKNQGIGLSACQCDLPYRMFVMGVAGGENGAGYVETIVNPLVTALDGEDTSIEGCLSFPGVFMAVKRAKTVTATYQDLNGVQQTKTFEGLTARVFLHEYDHTNGIKFTQHVKAFTYQKAKEKASSYIRRLNKAVKQAKINAAKQATAQKVINKAMLKYSTDSGSNLVLTTDSGPTLTVT